MIYEGGAKASWREVEAAAAGLEHSWVSSTSISFTRSLPAHAYVRDHGAGIVQRYLQPLENRVHGRVETPQHRAYENHRKNEAQNYRDIAASKIHHIPFDQS